MKFATKAIHAGITPDPSTGAIMTPVFQTSTYVQKKPGDHKGYEYSRTQNPTRNALQKNLAALENTKYGICFSSGMAAMDAVLKLLKPGDEVISTNDLYGGSYRIFTKIFQHFGIKFQFIDMQNIKNVEKYVNVNTRLLWIETPTNPMMNIIDIKGASLIAQKHKFLLAVDNTFASPYLQNPIELGAHLVVHSITKYISGHSDVVMGCICCDDDNLAEQLCFIQNSCGAVPGPQDCFLVLRGIKTLHLRMQQHCINAQYVAEFLAKHPKVKKVYWPGFETHPNHHIAKQQMKSFGGMLSFILKNDNLAAAINVATKTKIFSLAESLGGVESLIGHPATMTHASIPKIEREKAGVTDTLLRLSIGIEDKDDLIDDLKQSLQ